MKRSKYLLATMFSTTMLISGLGFSHSAKADGFPSLADQRVQTEIQELKAEGLTDEQINKFYEMSKEEYQFVQKHADDLYNESQEEIKKLKESGEIDEVLHKWNEPEYQPENKVSGSLGTKGDVLVSYEINSGSWSIGVGHAAIVSRNKAKTVEAWHKDWSPIKQDGVRRYTNNWGSKKKVYGLWVRKSNNDKYINAAKYAEKQADDKKKYNLNFFDKKTTKKFYCSQLAWRSWKNQGHDIDNIKWDTLVTPMELVKSDNTVIFHHRK
ncbi:septation ring formation regulator EzrA [Bacillus subtilis]|uniref:septation ring formation regulator EzrA n=1 Tax=Bacillus TaxID=1386 RepID=UPI0009B6B96A|nr:MULTISPECIES: septation ring formation regulator EzrA [Bacillus]ARB37305.1 septation ring formation regulator EzrA [Bacillus subtilis]MBR0009545.1 septation ring formation regulator EzrA [Bacillus subtilis]MDK7658413.1 septation ring formation regulator EzrA [Bacillus subtilis]QAW33257.1 septation ring formation regulator EzrA [Bacillus subtilis]QCU15215.1 septation ring formation regulator EzrA [Bacillus subtilis]